MKSVCPPGKKTLTSAESEVAIARFWEMLWVALSPSTPSTPTPYLDDRAVAQLSASHKAVFSEFLKIYDTWRRVNEVFPNYHARLTELRALRDRVVRCGPDLAWQCAAKVSFEQCADIERHLHHDVVLHKEVYAYMIEVVLSQIQAARRDGSPRDDAYERALEDVTGWWIPYLDVAGGLFHFKRYVIAQYFMVGVLDMIDGIQGTDDALHMAQYPQWARQVLTTFPDIWGEVFQDVADVIAEMPDRGMTSLAKTWAAGDQVLKKLCIEAQGQMARATDDLSVVGKEVGVLRKRLDRTESLLSQSKAETKATQEALLVARNRAKAMGADTAIDTHTLLSATQADLRESEKAIQRMSQRIEEQESELERLREFVGLLSPRRIPATGTEASPESDDPHLDLARCKVIVVGGHERLHARLRKELPRATFLHPDRSSVPAEIFPAADAVLFCITYCSHRITISAAQEAARQGIPFGYTVHNNVDLVLTDLAALVRNTQCPMDVTP